MDFMHMLYKQYTYIIWYVIYPDNPVIAGQGKDELNTIKKWTCSFYEQ